MIPIYLINLDRSSDRLARMAGQLKQLGLWTEEMRDQGEVGAV